MGIRVLRVLEYEYEDEKAAEADMVHWTHSYHYGNKRMRSATLPFTSIEWTPSPEPGLDPRED